MTIMVNIYYSGLNENTRKFVEEMITSGTVIRIHQENGNLRYECFFL